MRLSAAWKRTALSCAMLSLAACSDDPASPPLGSRGAYIVTELPAFGNSRSPRYDGTPFASYAYAVGPDGTAVGTAEEISYGLFGMAMWRNGVPSHVITGSICPVPTQCAGSAFDINARGQITGVRWTQTRGGQAWVTDGSTVRVLDDLPERITGDRFSMTTAINSDGDVVGWSGSYEHAVLWRAGTTTPIDLGTLGGVQSQALGINDAGWIVGFARATNHFRHAALWENGRVTDLGTLGGEESIALDINSRGEVVGWLGDIYDKHAFRWKDGVMSLLPGPGSSQAVAINSHGDIVGSTHLNLTPDGLRAVLWRGGQMHDLNELVAEPRIILSLAHDINDAGQIVVVGSARESMVERAFLLTPRSQSP